MGSQPKRASDARPSARSESLSDSRWDEIWGHEMVEEYRPWPAPLATARNVLDLPEPRRRLRTLVGVPEQICGRLLVRYQRRVVARRQRVEAQSDAAAADLLCRINSPDGDGWLHGEEEIALYEEILARVRTGWPFTLEQWLENLSLLHLYDRLVTLLQRARRGWADDDLWALDLHVTEVLAGGVRQIAELSFGWSDRLWSTHEEWVADLLRLADNLDRLSAHVRQHGGLSSPEAEAVCDEVFAMLRKSYGHLRVD
jgi:hypothetical protein